MREITSAMDGLRGLLALWVLLSHVTQMVDGPRGGIDRGGIAVDMFMMISGFLMMWNVQLREAKEPSSRIDTWLRFFGRRVFRIAPLFFLGLIPAYVFDSLYSGMLQDIYGAIGKDFIRPFRSCQGEPLHDIALHVTFLFGLFPCSASTNVLPDWSLSLEMQFYLVFPLLYLWLRRSSGLSFAVACLVVVGIATSVVGVYVVAPDKLVSYPQPSILPLRLNCFAVGMLLAYILVQRPTNLVPYASLLVALVTFQRFTFSALASVVVLMLLSKAGVWEMPFRPLRRLMQSLDAALSTKPLRFLGDVSFGVYLTHLLVLIPFIHIMNQQSLLAGMSGPQRFLVVTLLALPPVLLLSWIAHVLIERPAIEIGRRLTAPGFRRPVEES